MKEKSPLYIKYAQKRQVALSLWARSFSPAVVPLWDHDYTPNMSLSSPPLPLPKKEVPFISFRFAGESSFLSLTCLLKSVLGDHETYLTTWHPACFAYSSRTTCSLSTDESRPPLSAWRPVLYRILPPAPSFKRKVKSRTKLLFWQYKRTLAFINYRKRFPSFYS